MLSVFEDILLVITIVVCSQLVLLALNRWWSRERRRRHNDLIGWQFTVLGTTFAVIIGFMLYTVWSNFGVASVNVEQEANALVNIHRLARGLPEPQRDELRVEAETYANVVVDQEWPAMSHGEISPSSAQISRTMWRTLMSIQSPTWTQITSEDHALYELSTLTEHRQIRQLEITSKLPGILWCVLIIGGVLTIVSACMFGQDNTLLHSIQVLALSLLIALALVAIADIDRPFQGGVHVSDHAFRRAQVNMQGE